MKKILFLMAVAFVISSCGVGTYVPWAQNHFGAETRVVLDKANFRVVRDVEAVVEVNNTNLKRQDVEKSAYGQLLRNARLTGSQVLINVVVEEIVRENTDIFRALFRIPPKRKQYVAARATVIEFLKENGEPIQSISGPAESDTIIQYIPQQSQQNLITTLDEQQNTENIDIVQEIEEPVEMADAASVTKVLSVAHNITRKYVDYGNHFKVFKLLLTKTEKNPTKDNVDNLLAACNLLNSFSAGIKDPIPLDRELKDVSNNEEKIKIFLKYCE